MASNYLRRVEALEQQLVPKIREPKVMYVIWELSEDEAQLAAKCKLKEAEFRARGNWPDDGSHPVTQYVFTFARD